MTRLFAPIGDDGAQRPAHRVVADMAGSALALCRSMFCLEFGRPGEQGHVMIVIDPTGLMPPIPLSDHA